MLLSTKKEARSSLNADDLCVDLVRNSWNQLVEELREWQLLREEGGKASIFA